MKTVARRPSTKSSCCLFKKHKRFHTVPVGGTSSSDSICRGANDMVFLFGLRKMNMSKDCQQQKAKERLRATLVSIQDGIQNRIILKVKRYEDFIWREKGVGHVYSITVQKTRLDFFTPGEEFSFEPGRLFFSFLSLSFTSAVFHLGFYSSFRWCLHAVHDTKQR